MGLKMSDFPVHVDRPIGADVASSQGQDIGLPAVLLVDDQPARLLSYEAVLTDLPVRCVRALSGEQALAQLLREPFAAIVLDVSMPIMDGFETARVIRSHHRFQRTPILFVTGVHCTELDHLKGYEVGGIDYLPIPIVPEILRSKIAILVELYQRRSELEELNHALVSARSRLGVEPSDADGDTEPLGQRGSCEETDTEAPDGEFLQMLAHELRNALAPIYHVSELLLTETTGSNPIHPLVQMLRRYSSRISRLADVVDARANETLQQRTRELGAAPTIHQKHVADSLANVIGSWELLSRMKQNRER